jgi:twinkle protein
MTASAERGREFLDKRVQRITDADLRGYQSKAPDQCVRSILDYHLDVLKLLDKQELGGDTLPWPKTHGNFRFLPGEVTLWHGINGHGKSAVTSQVALWLAIHRKRSCLASFEMAPQRTLERMVKQAAGNGNPSESFVNEFFVNLCQYLFVYDRVGRVDPKMLFTAVRYCAEEKGTTHFFVDSLMRCVRGSDDYNGQKDFVEEACAVAYETQTHIHIIHHARKSENEDKVPNKFDARGAGEITDQVHNVFAVWKNKKKEREREEALKLGRELADETPDFLLICDKQRTLGWEGNWALWGDNQSWHFRESPKVPWQRGYTIPEYQRRVA